MKVVQLVGWYFPGSVGGSEVYVQRLSRELQARGVEVTVAAPYDDAEGHGVVERYEHDGLSVLRYPVPLARASADLRAQGAHQRFERFRAALAEERADIVHLHSFTYGANAHHLNAARVLGLRTFFTAHTPNVVCMRETMRRMGREVCDGRIDPAQCVPCYLEQKGTRAQVARGLSLLLGPASRLGLRAPGRLSTLLALPELVRERRADLHTLLAHSDHVIAVCEWLRAALIENGAQPERVTMLRQGVDVAPAPWGHESDNARSADAPLVIGFLGRAATVKGLQELVDAVLALPAAVRVHLRVHAIANNADERALLQRLALATRSDGRISFHAPVSPSEVPALMRHFDVLAVPSLWLETGPIVAMEALSQAVPVLGSRLGGIAELVTHGVNGWLEPAGDMERWSARMSALCADRQAVQQASLAARKTAVPTNAEVAAAVHALYAQTPSRRGQRGLDQGR